MEGEDIEIFRASGLEYGLIPAQEIDSAKSHYHRFRVLFLDRFVDDLEHCSIFFSRHPVAGIGFIFNLPRHHPILIEANHLLAVIGPDVHVFENELLSRGTLCPGWHAKNQAHHDLASGFSFEFHRLFVKLGIQFAELFVVLRP